MCETELASESGIHLEVVCTDPWTLVNVGSGVYDKVKMCSGIGCWGVRGNIPLPV